MAAQEQHNVKMYSWATTLRILGYTIVCLFATQTCWSWKYVKLTHVSSQNSYHDVWINCYDSIEIWKSRIFSKKCTTSNRDQKKRQKLNLNISMTIGSTFEIFCVVRGHISHICKFFESYFRRALARAAHHPVSRQISPPYHRFWKKEGEGGIWSRWLSLIKC